MARATAIDVDDNALRVAGENARLSGLEGRLDPRHAGPEAVAGPWPLVVADVLAAPLVEMASTLVRRVGHQGRLVVSGIPVSAEREVANACQHLGMHLVHVSTRAGWVATVLASGQRACT